ncbi:MAG: GAF domain-containing protein [Vicinamibacterales bacterium]|nr:GAF domain-containing protein [Vicinamibacterales bacterium]
MDASHPSTPRPHSPAYLPDGTTDGAAELLSTLFDLGREVTSVLTLDELLPKIPQLISRLTHFTVFAIYLLDAKREELHIAYADGYPDDMVRNFRVRPGQGIIGTAVAEQRPILVDDVRKDPRYLGSVPGVVSQLAVPLRHKNKVIGALNLLSDQPAAFTTRDEAILRQFGAHVAQAIVNARLFEAEREYGDTMETLAEIGREMSGILDLDALLTRVAHLVKRIVDYRTFGIALLDEPSQMLELKVAISYGDRQHLPAVPMGEGLVGYAALHKEPVMVPDVSKDARYINAVADARSELAVPMLLQDRCIGVFDLESPELDAFTKRHIELLTLLASQAAQAVENARLYEAIRQNEERMEKELRFAQRVQVALLPRELPKRLKGVDVAWHFDPARELGGDLFEFLSPDTHTLVAAVGDVSGKGVPAALYSVFAAEVVRGRTFRRRYLPERSTPADVLTSINKVLHERQLEEYYCTLCYAAFDLRKKVVTVANSGLPYPVRSTADGTSQIFLPGVPLGSFAGSDYDELTFTLASGDVFAICTDGVFEAANDEGEEFGAHRLIDVVRDTREEPAQGIVDAIFGAVTRFRTDDEQKDDMTVVVVKIA